MVERAKKFLAALALLFAIAMPMAAMPHTVYAQTQSSTIVDLPRIAEWIGKIWDDYLKDALIQGAATILINTMTYAADRLAYDAAVYISSGGDGDDPLFDNRNIGEYFSDYGAAVAGEAISQIDDSGLLGNFSLCNPSADVTFALKFGLKSIFDRQEPDCDIQDMKQNWEGFIADVATTLEGGDAKTAAILTTLSDMYNPSTNDFSIGITMTSSVLSQAQQKSFLEAQKQLLLNGFKDKTDFLTNKVDTPASILQDNLQENLKRPESTRQEVGIAVLSSSGEVLRQMALSAGQVFANTLISKGTERIYNGLFSNLDDVDVDPFDDIAYSSSNAEDARTSFGSFLAAAPLEITNYSILSEFSACPSLGRGLYNCVADTSFVSGIARASSGSPMTIAEAIEEGVLKEDWPLIPSADKSRNQDAYCYTYGYCHSNLVKLRKARVIPVGWELAAESTYNDVSSPVTLGEVVNGFDNCGSTGQPTEQYPWCHLIDPDWVLKYPDSQCRQQVYGQLLANPSTDQRKQECVDMPSCIDEDDDGNCTGGYGYCVREENVWRFRGEECPDYYATCTTYEDSEGDDVAFLSNTVDSGVCDEDSAGCLWYSTVKNDDSGSFDWPEVTSVASADADADAYAERIYFTAAVEECDAEDAGCRELVERDEDLSLNVITNPSFEDDEDDDGMPDAWFATDSSVISIDAEGAYSLNGSSAMSPSTTYVNQQGISLRQATTYTFSYYARQLASSTTTSVNAIVEVEGVDGGTIDFAGIEISGDCSISSSADNILAISSVPADTTYERFTCTFSVPTLSDAAEGIIATVALNGDLWFDQIQFEQDAEASDYHEGYSDTTLALAYVKTPPEYLGCTGEDDEPEECDDFAAVCEEQDVGCSEYTPTNGDPAVIGVANALDECPSTCVGYDTYKQEATLYEPEGDFPVYFIPDSAEECSEEAVGCDEFTNESTEALEYFTYLRACVTETQATANISSDNEAVFYTWEGSDLDGYQLVTWNLLESDLDESNYTYPSGEEDANPGLAPCSNWITTDAGITCDDDGDGDPEVDGSPIDASEDCDEHDDVLTNPDCREFYDAQGGIHYREWSSTVTVDNACVTYRKTEIVGDDATEQADNCEGSGGYYDTTSGICRYYGFADESNSCESTNAGCREYTGGRSRNSRQAFTEYFEDDTLAYWEADSASLVDLSNESVATDGHSLASDGEAVWTYVAVASECTNEDGCEGTEGGLGGTCTIAYGETTCGTLDGNLFDGKTYTLSFWAKGTGNIGVGFDIAASGSSVTTSTVDEFFDASVELEEGWNEYSLGPISMNDDDFGDGTVLAFVPASGVFFYIDNVILREGEDNITVIKDSWVTPAECDETPEGTDSPQYYLGCAEYTDQEGDTAYLKSFSSLCSEDQVGCSSYFMTQESDATNAQVFNAICSNDVDGDASDDPTIATSATDCYWDATGSAFNTDSRFLCTIGVGNTQCAFDIDFYVPLADLPEHVSYEASTRIVPADQEVFLVVNSDVECSSDVVGCEEVGLPTFSQDHTAVDSWTSTYLINDPDSYEDTLCTSDELFCEEWQMSDGDVAYFKDPQDQTCEYMTDVTISGVTYDGWFKTGTTELCYEDYVIGGDLGGLWRNGDDDYEGWVGTCEEKYNTCSEFQDLTDLTSDELYATADGESYYYLNNGSLEQSTTRSQDCDDQVGQKDGCGLFNDAGEPSKTYATSPSYILSIHADALLGQAPNSLVDPIDCESGSDVSTFEGVDLCEMRCAYVEGSVYDLTDPDSTDYVYDGSCYVNDDCRPIESEVGENIEGSCIAAGSANRIEDDANTVLKVDRDRECSEWLSCSDSTTTWDERTNSFKTVCNDIELCTEYSTSGNSSFCSEWKFDDTETVLDEEKYTTRDVSWYGEEFSGYAIPETFPVQTLTQVNVAPPIGKCNLLDDYQLELVSDADWATYQGIDCSSDTTCGASSGVDEGELGYGWCVQEGEDDYRLAYVAGSCEGEYGDSCSVGYCSDTGASCAESADCGNGASCLIGSCYEVLTGTDNICENDGQCDSGQTCYFGYCAYDRDEITIEAGEDSCDDLDEAGGSMTFSRATSAKYGSCMRGSCVLTPDGSTFDTDDSETVACRAYPELNSPFPTDVVQEWRNFGESEPTSDAGYGALPWSYRSGYSTAQTCVNGETCDCSYTKVTFGSGTFKYFNQDTDFPINDQSIGLCVGGTLNGALCGDDDYTGTEWEGNTVTSGQCTDAGGTSCSYPTASNNVLGLDGYCLERDSGMNILGDRDEYACLTWLPVDQLAGSTDLYAKYKSAGFFEDAYMCSYLSPYANVGMSSHGGSEDDTACAETDGGLGDLLDSYNSGALCAERLDCPDGFVAILGAAGYSNGAANDYIADSCAEGSGVDQDCPFVCVPEISSISTDDGYDQCNFEEYSAGWADIVDVNANGTKVYYASNYNEDDPTEEGVYGAFDDAVAYFNDCWARGVEMTENFAEVADFPMSSTNNGHFSEDCDADSHTADDGYRCLKLTIQEAERDGTGDLYPYAACEALTQVASTDGEGFAWTNRIKGIEDYELVTATTNTAYSYSVMPSFGMSQYAPSDFEGGMSPAKVAQCTDSGSYTLLQSTDIGSDSAFNECPTGYDYPDSRSGDDPDARSFVSFDYNTYTIQTSTGPDEGLSIDDIWTIDSANDSTQDSIAIITQLFVKANALPTRWWDGRLEVDALTDRTYQEPSDGIGSYLFDELDSDDWDVRADYGNRPSIFGVDLEHCENDVCEEDTEKGLTLNEQNSGDVEGTDFYRAYLKFYAAADKNQLPIRRVIVDWQDDIETGSGGATEGTDDQVGSSSSENFYKNHRGLWNNSEQLICETGETDAAYEWGMNGDSCDPYYFSYSHIYSCTSDILSEAPSCSDDDGDGKLDFSPCQNENLSCSFQPRVHIRDNWGLCTGTCSGTATHNTDGTENCVDNDGSLGGSSAQDDECNYTAYPSSTDPDTDPWVYYDGIVTVTP